MTESCEFNQPRIGLCKCDIYLQTSSRDHSSSVVEALRHLQLLETRLLFQGQQQRSFKYQLHWSPSQRATNEKSVFMLWRDKMFTDSTLLSKEIEESQTDDWRTAEGRDYRISRYWSEIRWGHLVSYAKIANGCDTLGNIWKQFPCGRGYMKCHGQTNLICVHQIRAIKDPQYCVTK